MHVCCYSTGCVCELVWNTCVSVYYCEPVWNCAVADASREVLLQYYAQSEHENLETMSTLG